MTPPKGKLSIFENTGLTRRKSNVLSARERPPWGRPAFARRSLPRPGGLSPLGGEQFQVGAFEKIGFGNAQRCHDLLCFADAGVNGFAVGQDFLQLKEVSQSFDAVDVDM